MQRRSKILAVGGTLVVLAGGGATYAVAGGGDDGDEQATGPEADRARDAALAANPGARANAVERDSEGGATWEVELGLANGKTVDVRLDEKYSIVKTETDSENESETADGD